MNRKGWEQVSVEYGQSSFRVWVPGNSDVLGMVDVPAFQDPRSHIESALNNPVSGPRLESIISSLKKPARAIRAAIAVSDNTRPVPYNGDSEEGILLPLLRKLGSAGIEKRNVKIIVATGTHAPTTDSWKLQAFGSHIVKSYDIVDHDCSDDSLPTLASFDGVPVKINSFFYDADLRIVTGLVEPHFMAGFSGGRKAVCPGLVNLDVTHHFHSAEFMDNPHATNLVLEHNPCHRFAHAVAQRLGVHFSINVALNSDMRLSGVWAGELQLSLERAVGSVRRWVEVKAAHEYDILLTHGGRVAVNHYQAVKAAYSVIPIIKRGGVAILVAHNGDTEPIGKEQYRKLLQVLRQRGPGSFTELLKSRHWKFTPDQWEVQKLDQFFTKVGSFDGLMYCTTNIKAQELIRLPGRSGYECAGSDCTDIASMVQCAIDHAVSTSPDREPRFAYVKDGPYASPVLQKKMA
jgi:nickel-dependent lactate racemase